jgi:hypothetical protein
MLFPTDIRFIVDVWRLLLLPDTSRWHHRKRLLEKEERSISRHDESHRLSLSLSLSLSVCMCVFFLLLSLCVSFLFFFSIRFAVLTPPRDVQSAFSDFIERLTCG